MGFKVTSRIEAVMRTAADSETVATTNEVPISRGCAYHDNATEHCEQGTHVSAVPRIVRMFSAKDEMRYLRGAREDSV